MDLVPKHHFQMIRFGVLTAKTLNSVNIIMSGLERLDKLKIEMNFFFSLLSLEMARFFHNSPRFKWILSLPPKLQSQNVA